jgi:hypothetical protein
MELDTTYLAVYDGEREVCKGTDFRKVFADARRYATAHNRRVELVRVRTIIQHQQTVHPQS